MSEPNTHAGYVSDKVKTGNYSKTENPYPDQDKPKSPAEQHAAALARISPVWLAVAAAGAFLLLRPSEP